MGKISSMRPGDEVKIKNLVNAAQHNGKVGIIIKTNAPDGRVGVKLGADDGGKTLAVKIENLEFLHKKSTNDDTAGKGQRTLKRDNALLREFDGSPDPDTLALYYHYGDRAFDAYNGSELINQILHYYKHNLQLKLVAPRKIGPNEYYLLCLQHSAHAKNTLCELAFK